MIRAFFDTNILVYGYSADDRRQARAKDLLEAGGAISVQCLNEFASVMRRKHEMSWDRLDEALSIISELCRPIVPLDLSLHRIGLRMAMERKLAIYDGMIIAAALTAGCDTLYSEDMHHGLMIDGALTIVNPFRAS